MPSLHEYVLVSQDEPRVERCMRQRDGLWGFAAAVGLDAELVLTTGPVRVSLADIYAGITFPETPPR